MNQCLMSRISNGKNMRWIFGTSSSNVTLLMLARVQAEIGEWIHSDQNVTDVRVNLIQFESLLQIFANRFFGEYLQCG